MPLSTIYLPDGINMANSSPMSEINDKNLFSNIDHINKIVPSSTLASITPSLSANILSIVEPVGQYFMKITNSSNPLFNTNSNEFKLTTSASTSTTGITIARTTTNLPITAMSNFTNNLFNSTFNSYDEKGIISSGNINEFENGIAIRDDDYVDETEYVFDRTDVRIIFITLYSLVFCCCFFGNLLVILVVTLSRRLRSITNFFLANLAVADFCVGVFCVMQNLTIYLIDSWVFGEFLCRMYQFVHSLSYTASIFILVVICMERYFAIVHPITCKQILTASRLRMVILTVWITSAVYSTPKFIFSKTITNVYTRDGSEEHICVLDRKMFNSKLLDLINFGLLYLTPLLVMTILYSKIAIALWRSSRGLTHHTTSQSEDTPMYSTSSNTTLHLGRKRSSKYDKRGGVGITESQVSLDSDKPVVTACQKASFLHHHHHHQQHHHQHQHQHHQHHQQQQQQQQQFNCQSQSPQSHNHHNRHGTQRISHMSHSSNNVLRARRGVIRMLIIFVLTFALCNLPYHARKMWQYWSHSYRGDSNFNALFTPLTFLVTYFNSGVNPLLYAFLSRNFRKGMKELLLCSFKKGKGSSSSSVHHRRFPLQTHHSLPTDTTHIGNDQL